MKRKSLESSFKLPSNHQSAGVAAAHTILPPPHRNSPHFRKNMSLIAIPHESPIMDLKGPLDHTQAALLVARNQRNVGRSERQSSCESSSLSTTCPHISAASIRNQLGLFDANDVGSGLDGDLDSIVPGTGLKTEHFKACLFCSTLPNLNTAAQFSSQLGIHTAYNPVPSSHMLDGPDYFHRGIHLIQPLSSVVKSRSLTTHLKTTIGLQQRLIHNINTLLWHMITITMWNSMTIDRSIRTISTPLS
jgi:hypothetical protein